MVAASRIFPSHSVVRSPDLAFCLCARIVPHFSRFICELQLSAFVKTSFSTIYQN
jgi:hypothetical protein